MSEFLAEARILVRPDTTRFRAELEALVLSATKGIAATIPVTPIVTGAGLGGLSAQAATTTAAVQGLAAAELAGAQATRTAAQASAEHARQISQVEKAAVASAASLGGLRGAVLTAGTAFLGATIGIQAFAKAVGSTVQFQRQLNVFRVTAGATADEMERVGQTARDLGRDISLPGVSAADAAQTLTELSKAGLSVQQSLDAARGTLQLATAAQIDNAAATELVANALNAFQLSGTEATRVADLLAGAANASQGSIADMGLALKQAAAAARLVGLDVNETITLLTELARAGLSASDAGTSLRTLLVRLVGDFPKVQKEVERLGLDLRDMSGNIRPEFFSELGDRLQEMTPKAKQATLALLGGADAVRAISILQRSSIQQFRDTEAAISRSGIAAEVAGAQTEGLGGDAEATKNELADLGLTVGRVASGPLSLLVRTTGQAAGALNDLTESIERSRGGQSFFQAFGATINDFANSFARLNISFQQGVRLAQDTRKAFSELDAVTQNVTTSVDELAEALRKASEASLAKQGIPETGLGVQQILNRVTGFDTAEVAARIHGDTNELLSVLQREREFLLSQLQRQFVRNRPALFRELQDALLGVTNDIIAISKQGATEAKRAAAEAAQARREADQALLDLLSNRREDAQRRAATAATTEGLTDDIRAQDRLQALIKQQIQKVRDRIKDEKTRRAAIRDLRIALIASRQEEERLQKEQIQQAAENKQTSIQLDIDLAVTTENTNREIAARRRLIALLKKQQAQVKKGTIEWKRLRNEIAEQQEAIKDAQKQAESGEDARKKAARFFFEQLQAQQGFASNLLGNLIPRGQTAGLVSESAGVSTTDVGGRITVEAAAARGRASGGPTAGQVNSTNDLLLKILNQLKHLNGLEDAPEAKHQRRVGRAALDYHH